MTSATEGEKLPFWQNGEDLLIRQKPSGSSLLPYNHGTLFCNLMVIWLCI